MVFINLRSDKQFHRHFFVDLGIRKNHKFDKKKLLIWTSVYSVQIMGI